VFELRDGIGVLVAEGVDRLGRANVWPSRKEVR